MKTLKPAFPPHVCHRRALQARLMSMHRSSAIPDTGKNETLLLIFASIIGDPDSLKQFIRYVDREHDSAPETFSPPTPCNDDEDELTFGDYDWSALGGE